MPFVPLRPIRVFERSPSELAIEWSDGHCSYHRYRTLRFHCWCAACRDEHTGRERIRFEDIPADIHPLRIEPLGTYALHFYWSDGHATGIHSYDLLRRICECPDCAARQHTDALSPPPTT